MKFSADPKSDACQPAALPDSIQYLGTDLAHFGIRPASGKWLHNTSATNANHDQPDLGQRGEQDATWQTVQMTLMEKNTVCCNVFPRG